MGLIPESIKAELKEMKLEELLLWQSSNDPNFKLLAEYEMGRRLSILKKWAGEE